MNWRSKSFKSYVEYVISNLEKDGDQYSWGGIVHITLHKNYSIPTFVFISKSFNEHLDSMFGISIPASESHDHWVIQDNIIRKIYGKIINI